MFFAIRQLSYLGGLPILYMIHKKPWFSRGFGGRWAPTGRTQGLGTGSVPPFLRTTGNRFPPFSWEGSRKNGGFNHRKWWLNHLGPFDHEKWWWWTNSPWKMVENGGFTPWKTEENGGLTNKEGDKYGACDLNDGKWLFNHEKWWRDGDLTWVKIQMSVHWPMNHWSYGVSSWTVYGGNQWKSGTNQWILGVPSFQVRSVYAW